MDKKAEESGRVLSAKEIEFVSLQHERNSLLHAEERGEAGEKRLVAIRKRLNRLYPMDKFLKSVPKSPSERKRDSRNAMSVEARNIEKERNRTYQATPEAKENTKLRVSGLREKRAKERERRQEQFEAEKMRSRMKRMEKEKQSEESKLKQEAFWYSGPTTPSPPRKLDLGKVGLVEEELRQELLEECLDCFRYRFRISK